MEPIKDLPELQPILDALQAKGLLVYLSPPGRGSLVTHALFLERELDKVRRDVGLALRPTESSWADGGASESRRLSTAPPVHINTSSGNERHDADRPVTEMADTAHLFEQLQRLQQELADVKGELLATRTQFESTLELLRRDLTELNRQLGN
jgi:hypothetical protein